MISDEPVPAGDVQLGLEFTITGRFEIASQLTAMGIQGVSGQGTLCIKGKEVGSGQIARTVPFGWTLTGDGLCCGFDSETPVSDLYQAPFHFTGEIDRVVVSVSGKPFESAAKDIERAFLIDWASGSPGPSSHPGIARSIESSVRAGLLTRRCAGDRLVSTARPPKGNRGSNAADGGTG